MTTTARAKLPSGLDMAAKIFESIPKAAAASGILELEKQDEEEA